MGSSGLGSELINITNSSTNCDRHSCIFKKKLLIENSEKNHFASDFASDFGTFTSANLVKRELLWLNDVVAFPNASKIVFAAEMLRSKTLYPLDLPTNDKIWNALSVFPDPDSPVSNIDCGLSLIERIILFAKYIMYEKI